jgi:hypothetical protein
VNGPLGAPAAGSRRAGGWRVRADSGHPAAITAPGSSSLQSIRTVRESVTSANGEIWRVRPGYLAGHEQDNEPRSGFGRRERREGHPSRQRNPAPALPSRRASDSLSVMRGESANDRQPRCSACKLLAPGAAVPAAGAGGSLLIAAVLARPLPVPVIKRVTEPARRQNASKCHQQGSDKRCPQDHRAPMP